MTMKYSTTNEDIHFHINIGNEINFKVIRKKSHLRGKTRHNIVK